MDFGVISYFLFGVVLVVVFIVIIKYYFSPKRKEEVEKAKYKMLEDDIDDGLSDDKDE